MVNHFIGFWNLENLFDISSSTQRPDYLKNELRNELEGWTASVLRKKLAQLVKIIMQMNGGLGPDILGICEIENEAVVQKLLDTFPSGWRNYKIAHADTRDKRGIDVAIIYDSDKYEAELQFSYFVQKRTATRDIFQVNLKTRAGRALVIIGNHWPSRSGGGQYKSEPYRMMVGEALAYFHKRILEELGRDTAIVVMGDFNDEPFDRSIREYAQVTRERRKIMNARSVDYFYNLMWETVGRREATYYYGSQPNILDQFWVSKGILKQGTAFSVKEIPVENTEESKLVEIFRPAELVADTEYPKARRFGRPSSPSTYNEEGYSDHFPITMILEEKDTIA